MNGATVIFYAVFVIPLIVFLVWLMRQDKRKGTMGLVVLAVLIVGVIAYMYFKKMFILNSDVYISTGMIVW
jgi:uncharacterized membrane protein YqjE